ncbi:hypothetical protein K9M79_04460 [Candidatus Woesearchaeota archaeon]|nr:hypothetical protein [Candidatus Woesearchaeota archaeon]
MKIITCFLIFIVCFGIVFAECAEKDNVCKKLVEDSNFDFSTGDVSGPITAEQTIIWGGAQYKGPGTITANGLELTNGGEILNTGTVTGKVTIGKDKSITLGEGSILAPEKAEGEIKHPSGKNALDLSKIKKLDGVTIEATVDGWKINGIALPDEAALGVNKEGAITVDDVPVIFPPDMGGSESKGSPSIEKTTDGGLKISFTDSTGKKQELPVMGAKSITIRPIGQVYKIDINDMETLTITSGTEVSSYLKGINSKNRGFEYIPLSGDKTVYVGAPDGGSLAAGTAFNWKKKGDTYGAVAEQTTGSYNMELRQGTETLQTVRVKAGTSGSYPENLMVTTSGRVYADKIPAKSVVWAKKGQWEFEVISDWKSRTEDDVEHQILENTRQINDLESQIALADAESKTNLENELKHLHKKQSRFSQNAWEYVHGEKDELVDYLKSQFPDQAEKFDKLKYGPGTGIGGVFESFGEMFTLGLRRRYLEIEDSELPRDQQFSVAELEAIKKYVTERPNVEKYGFTNEHEDPMVSNEAFLEVINNQLAMAQARESADDEVKRINREIVNLEMHNRELQQERTAIENNGGGDLVAQLSQGEVTTKVPSGIRAEGEEAAQLTIDYKEHYSSALGESSATFQATLKTDDFSELDARDAEVSTQATNENDNPVEARVVGTGKLYLGTQDQEIKGQKDDRTLLVTTKVDAEKGTDVLLIPNQNEAYGIWAKEPTTVSLTPEEEAPVTLAYDQEKIKLKVDEGQTVGFIGEYREGTSLSGMYSQDIGLNDGMFVRSASQLGPTPVEIQYNDKVLTSDREGGWTDGSIDFAQHKEPSPVFTTPEPDVSPPEKQVYSGYFNSKGVWTNGKYIQGTADLFDAYLKANPEVANALGDEADKIRAKISEGGTVQINVDALSNKRKGARSFITINGEHYYYDPECEYTTQTCTKGGDNWFKYNTMKLGDSEIKMPQVQQAANGESEASNQQKTQLQTVFLSKPTPIGETMQDSGIKQQYGLDLQTKYEVTINDIPVTVYSNTDIVSDTDFNFANIVAVTNDGQVMDKSTFVNIYFYDKYKGHSEEQNGGIIYYQSDPSSPFDANYHTNFVYIKNNPDGGVVVLDSEAYQMYLNENKNQQTLV